MNNVPTRRGFTIIHTLVTITVISILTGMAGVILVRITDANLAMRHAIRWHQTAIQLDQTLRADIHDAIDFSIDNEQIALQMPDGRKIEYDITSNRNTTIERTETAGSADLLESYRLPSQAMGRWSTQIGPSGSQLIELVVTRAQDRDASEYLFQLVARLNDGDKRTSSK